MQQDYPKVFGVDVSVTLARQAQELVNLGSNLDAGVASACNDERESLSLVERILLHIGCFQHADQMVAETEGVAERLEPHRMLLDAGELREVGCAAYGEYQMVVGNISEASMSGVANGDCATIGIHGFDLGLMHVRVRNDAANGADDIERAD